MKAIAELLDKPAAFAIVPSILALAVLYSQIPVSTWTPAIRFVADTPAFFRQISQEAALQEGAQPINMGKDNGFNERPVDLQKLSEETGIPADMWSVKYKKEPVINIPDSIHIGVVRQVTLKLTVDKKGRLIQAQIERPSGLPLLDMVVLEAYRDVEFYPFDFAGKESAVILRQTVQVDPPDLLGAMSQLTPATSAAHLLP